MKLVGFLLAIFLPFASAGAAAATSVPSHFVPLAAMSGLIGGLLVLVAASVSATNA